jgi:hypothetical protein
MKVCSFDFNFPLFVHKYSVAGSFDVQDSSSAHVTTLDDSLLTRLRYERQEMLSSTPHEDSGNAQIDDSLLDDEDDADVDADQTLKESEAETVKTGVLQEYLKEVLERIKGQIKNLK